MKPGSHLVLGETDPALRPVFEAEGPADGVGPGRGLRRRDRPAGPGRPRRRPAHAVRRSTRRCSCPSTAPTRPTTRPSRWPRSRRSSAGRWTPEVVAEAFGGLQLPGRFEVLHRAPLLVLDGAHNPDGAQAAAGTLADEFEVAGTRHWVLGPLAGPGRRRDARRVRRPSRRPRGGDDAAVAPGRPGRRAGGTSPPRREVRGRARRVGAAVSGAWRDAEAAGEGDLVMVTGSLYTGRRRPHRLPAAGPADLTRAARVRHTGRPTPPSVAGFGRRALGR